MAMTADDIGYTDGQKWATKASLEELESIAQHGWDDALLDAIGFEELMTNLCGVPYTADNWNKIGAPWCAAYNAAAARGARDKAAERIW